MEANKRGIRNTEDRRGRNYSDENLRSKERKTSGSNWRKEMEMRQETTVREETRWRKQW